jgi:hypothetical protein
LSLDYPNFAHCLPITKSKLFWDVLDIKRVFSYWHETSLFLGQFIDSIVLKVIQILIYHSDL